MSHHKTKIKANPANEHFADGVLEKKRKANLISPKNNPWHPRTLHCECDKICDEHIPEQGQEGQPLVKYWYKVK
jgi:hypothetical protein